MKKNVVFIGTRNMYPHMIPPILSLIEHTKVDMIYLLIEDDEFPYNLPCKYKAINVSHQTFFLPGSINYKNYFTYICLLRVALTKILPDVDQVLSLDDDVIIADDISPMWDVDLKGKWLAAVPETYKWGVDTECYYNCGVVMYNLAQMRKDKIDDAMIKYLNEVEVTFSDQVAVNHFLATNPDKAVPYPVRYNEFCNSGSTNNPAIIHYCGYTDWITNRSMPRVEYLDKYRKQFIESDIKYNLSAVKIHNSDNVAFMIHACPKRMWYVNNFLIPQLVEQGFNRDDIIIWNDTEGLGNLEYFVRSMEYVAEHCPADQEIWHLQDDVLLAKDFSKYVNALSGLVYGFTNVIFNPVTWKHTGNVTLPYAWTSFQCVCIPNILASDFCKWFRYQTSHGFRLMPWTATGKCDDTVFNIFLQEKKPGIMLFNAFPNMVEHIDFLLGGSTLSDRDSDRRSCYWDDEAAVEDLRKRIAEYWDGIDDAVKAIEGYGADESEM